jgi:hypothetical protein
MSMYSLTSDLGRVLLPFGAMVSVSSRQHLRRHSQVTSGFPNVYSGL